MTKFSNRYLKSIEDSELEIIRQIDSDLNNALELGYLDTEEYAISYDDGVATILDKINDEITKFQKDEDEWILMKLPTKSANSTTEISEDPKESVGDSEEDSTKEYASIKDGLIVMRVGDQDISYNTKTREVISLDDPNIKWRVPSNQSLIQFLKDAESKLKDKNYSYSNPSQEADLDSDYNEDDLVSEFSTSGPDYSVVRYGGSIGSKYTHRGPQGPCSIYDTGLSKDEAEDICKRLSNSTSPDEKKYCDVKYSVVLSSELKKLDHTHLLSEGTKKLLAKRQLKSSEVYSELSKKTKDYIDKKFSRSKLFSEITTDEQFRDYAHTVMKNAHGSNYSEGVTNKVVDDLLESDHESYGELVGRLTSGLGNSNK